MIRIRFSFKWILVVFTVLLLAGGVAVWIWESRVETSANAYLNYIKNPGVGFQSAEKATESLPNTVFTQKIDF